MSKYKPTRATQGQPQPVIQQPRPGAEGGERMTTGEAFGRAAETFRGSPTEFVAPKEVKVGAQKVVLPGGSVFDRIPQEWQRRGGYYYPPGDATQPKNFDKLTKAEQWLYTKGLPWLSETPVMSIADRMLKWNKGWLGRILPAFDVLAEGVERGVGMMVQLEDARRRGPTAYNQLMSDLGSAWRAGSIAYDVMGIPSFLVGPQGVEMEDSAMPGIIGMNKARNLISQGASIEEAKAAVYEDMGALMLRGQIQDTFLHIFADPLNVILSEAKLITRVHAIRNAALLDAGRATVAEVRLAREMADAAESALRAAEAAGRPLDMSADLVRDAIRAAETAAELEGKAFSPAQRFAVWITGGMPFSDKAVQSMSKGKWASIAARLNPFELTPQARAAEVLQLTSKLTENMIAGETDVNRILETISKAASGAFSGEVGHIMATPAGRNLQSFMKGSSARVEALTSFYRANEGAITDVRAMADLVGEDVHRFMAGLQKDPAATWAKVQAALGGAPSDATRAARSLVEEGVAARALGPDAMKGIAETFKEAPFSLESFKLYALNEVMDQAKQQAILQFGVKASGFWQNAAEELKALETLAFLRLNPAYAVKNWWNNKITMVARGVYGHMPLDDIWKFWESEVGVIPPRLASGYGAADIAVAVEEGLGPAARAQGAYQRAAADLGKVASGKPGIGKRISERVTKILGRLDAGKWAANMEASASMQATTKAFMDLWPEMLGRMVDDLDKVVPGLAGKLGPEVSDAVRAAVKASYKGEALDTALLTRNLNNNMEAVISELSKATGMSADEVSGIFPRDFMYRLERDLIPAMETGDPAAVRQTFASVVRRQERAISEAAQTDALAAAERNLELMQVDGPQGYFRSWSEAYNKEFGIQEAWINQLDREVPWIRSLEDTGLRRSAWAGLKRRGAQMFDQHTDWLSRHFNAMVDSGRAHGLPFSDAIPNAVETRITSIRGFHEFREAGLENFFSKAAGLEEDAREALWAETKIAIDGEYRKLITGETMLAKQIDDSLEPLVSQTNREAFRAARMEIRNLRESYMNDMMDPAKRMNSKLRMTHQTDIYNAERRAEMVAMGDRVARAEIQPQVRAMTMVDSARNKALAGRTLEPLEREALDNFLSKRVLAPEDERLRSLFGPFSDESLKAQVARIQTERMRPVPEMEKTWDSLFRETPRPGSSPAEIKIARQDIIRNWAQDNMPDELAEWSRLSIEEKAVEAGTQVASAERQARMGDLSRAMETGARDALRPNVDEALLLWKGDAIDKRQLIEFIQADLQGSARIQDMEQWALREQGMRTVRFFRRTNQPTSEGLRVRPWDSVSSSEEVAFEFGAHPGRIIEIEVPVENVFSSYRTHPGLGRYSGTDRELEFILNQKGVAGGRIITIDNHAPNEKEMFFLAEMYPEMWKPAVPPPGAATEWLPDARKMVPDQMPQPGGMAELWNSHGAPILDQMREAAVRVSGKKAVRFNALSPDAQADLLKYTDYVKSRMPAVRMATMNMAEMKRDAALLNYTRRTRFDTLSGSLFPYAFWMTHSVFNWALWSLEKPFVLSAFMRMRKLYDTAKARPGWPSRMKGYGEVPLVQGVLGKMPFWEDWMGPLYANPLGIGLPFQQWLYPFEQSANDAASRDARVRRILDDQLERGEITREQRDAALETQDGPEWSAANSQAEEGQDGVFDLVNSIAAPHAPLIWAYNAARGRPFAPGPFLPATRTIKAVTAMAGVGPPGGINVEAGLRKFLGLPEFDEWDDYRVDRMLVNMAADGSYPTAAVMQAMIDRAGPVYDEAKRRAGKEYGVRAMGGLAGIPITIFPPGEEKARALYTQFGEAMDAYNAGRPEVLTKFFDDHPEAKVRLALFKEPGDRLNQFLVDEIWERYFSLPELQRRQVVDALGEPFERNFLDRETRNTENVDPETLSMWLAFMRGEGMLTGTGGDLMRMAPAEDARAMQAYYDTIRTYFPADIYDLQKRYFMLEKGGARRTFLSNHPELGKYWDWRRDFMYRNPALAQYIEEDPDKWPKYPSEKELGRVLAQQPLYNWEEWTTILGGPTSRLVMDRQGGKPLPAAAERRLNEVAESFGMTQEELMDALEAALGQ